MNCTTINPTLRYMRVRQVISLCQYPFHNIPNAQLECYALLDLVSKGIWLCNDQATPYLIDP
jgi:hypothetical protein